MKKRLVMLGIVVALLFSGQSVSPAKAAKSNILTGVNHYQIYYGQPTEAILKDMARFDLVIIEPQWYTKAQIERIQSQGTKVLGYINVMEADNWNKSVMSQMKPADFFYRNGQKVYFSKWDSYLTDITSANYHTILLGEIQKHITSKGINGVFLDTVGNIDDQHSKDAKVLAAQRGGLKTFLEKVRASYGNLPLVQNWGFDTLASTTAPYVDGIMWESFESSVMQKDQWSQTKIQQLKSLQVTYGTRVLTVSFSEPSYEYAWSHDFIHTFDPDYFNTWTATDLPVKKAEEQVVTPVAGSLENVDSYRIYFGSPTAKMLKEATAYDLVVIEPTLYTKQQIQQLKAKGTIVMGQMTVTQVSQWQSGLYKQVQKKDVFNNTTLNGGKTYLMNLTSPSYQALLQQELSAQVVAKGLDGIYVSTAADLEWTYPKASQAAQQQGYAEFVKKVKEQNLLVIQSDAFTVAKNQTAPIDGIAWMPFNQSEIKKAGWSKQLVEDLKKLDETTGLKVFTSSTKDQAASAKYSVQNGFVHTHSTNHFSKW